MTSRTGGRLLVDSLIANGITFGTCVPGESFLAILDAIYAVNGESGEPAFRLITARHEAAAANMVEAAGKLDGRPSVCFVTRGPGAMHAAIAVHTAYQDGTPLLLVVGQIARELRGREAFQEMDYAAVFGTTTKRVIEIDHADRVGEQVARAVYVATSGWPGPVVLVVPEDMLVEATTAEPVVAPALSHPVPAPAAVDDLLHRLATAERPLVITGGPHWTSDTSRNLLAFAEANGVPLAAGFRWQDTVDNRSDNYVGYLGLGCSPELRAQAQEADLIVGFGGRLDDPTTDGYSLVDRQAPGQAVVLVGEEPADAVTTLIPHAVLTASADAVAAQLAGRTLPESGVRRAWTERLRSEHLRFIEPTESVGEVNVAEIVRHVRATVPDGAIVTTGAGNYTVWVQRFFQFRERGTQLAPRNGAMGYGYPAALSAAAVRPGTPVIAFAGDGCVLMSGSEIATAVRERLRVVLIVINNGMFATIRMHQENAYPGRPIATDLTNPDFTAYGESFGATTFLVESTEQFAQAFEAALAHEGPTLIEVRSDPRQITPDRRLAVTAKEQQ